MSLVFRLGRVSSLTPPHPLHPPIVHRAGLPKDNDFTHCDRGGTSCYFLNTTLLSFPAAQKACKRQGAHLVAWNTQTEQVGRPGGGWVPLLVVECWVLHSCCIVYVLGS
jgi:hypothetical protein